MAIIKVGDSATRIARHLWLSIAYYVTAMLVRLRQSERRALYRMICLLDGATAGDLQCW